MQIILYSAVSANGVIARENGEEDFLSDANWELFCELAKKCGCFAVGRKTYEIVKNWNAGYSFDDLVGVQKIIISQDVEFKPEDGYETAHSPEEAVEKLSSQGFKKMLVAGGSTVNTSFAKTKLLNKIILSIEPVVVGDGIFLFAREKFNLNLILNKVKKEKDGRIILDYDVINNLNI